MRTFNLVHENDEALKQLTKPVAINASDLQHFIKEEQLDNSNYFELMIQRNGIGLAANQVGLPYSFFAMQFQLDGFIPKPKIVEKSPIAYNGRRYISGTHFIFNPKIEILDENDIAMKEGCLSFPGLYVTIKRPKTIKMTWLDEVGEEHSDILGGINARCALHEFDHLQGITFIQKAGKNALSLGLKNRLKNLRK